MIKHGDNDGGHGEDAAENGQQRPGDKLSYHIDIIDGAGDDTPNAVAAEKVERKLLQVCKKLLTQLIDNGLPYP